MPAWQGRIGSYLSVWEDKANYPSLSRYTRPGQYFLGLPDKELRYHLDQGFWQSLEDNTRDSAYIPIRTNRIRIDIHQRRIIEFEHKITVFDSEGAKILGDLQKRTI